MFFGFLFYGLTVSVCRRWSRVAKALLVEKIRDTELEHAPVDAVEAQSGAPVLAEERVQPIDHLACILLCFFFTNLTLCLMWYAFLYDSAGTVNPSWTDVFG